MIVIHGPTRALAYTLYIALPDKNSQGVFIVNPTLAAADFAISKDGGVFSALATTPTVTPAGSCQVKLSLSAAEMNAIQVTIRCSDDDGNEWGDELYCIITKPNDFNDPMGFTPGNRSVNEKIRQTHLVLGR